MKKPGANAMAAIACVFGVMFMTGAAFAAVPLYRMFCQVTGFDGTVRKADKAPDVQLDQTVLIRFDTNVRGLPMTFRAEQVTQRVRIGETGLAYFDVTNTSDRPIQATAAYNVVPERAGPPHWSLGRQHGARGRARIRTGVEPEHRCRRACRGNASLGVLRPQLQLQRGGRQHRRELQQHTRRRLLFRNGAWRDDRQPLQPVDYQRFVRWY